MKLKLGKLTLKTNLETKCPEFGVVLGFYKYSNIRGMFLDISFYFILMINFDLECKK